MEWPHIHIAINHIPIIGIWFAVVLLTVALAGQSRLVKQVSLWTIVALALATIGVYISGMQAADVLPDRIQVPELQHYIEHHAKAAQLTFWTLEATGLFALLGLWLTHQNKPAAKGVLVLLLVASVGVGLLAAATAELGGAIRHTEIRDNAFSRYVRNLFATEQHSAPHGS